MLEQEVLCLYNEQRFMVGPRSITATDRVNRDPDLYREAKRLHKAWKHMAPRAYVLDVAFSRHPDALFTPSTHAGRGELHPHGRVELPVRQPRCPTYRGVEELRPLRRTRNLPMTTPPYEPEEYPRCEQCGRLAMHSRATLCSVCLVNTTLKEPPKPSPLGAHTANDFTVAKKP